MTATTTQWLGLMTGSSADGCDMVVMAEDQDGYHCVQAQHVTMPPQLKQDVLSLLHPKPNELHHAMTTHQLLACWMAEAVLRFLADVGMDMADIEAVGLHGQTIRHQPDLTMGYTQQLCCPSRLSALLGCPVVADFRSADMAVGGQGAPLAPFFHRAFFAGPNRAILNIGGIANLTLLGDVLLGFDTGPGNALMDAWCMAHRQQPYDDAGQWAESGQVIPALLDACMADPFFAKKGPKATGRDYFSLAWLQEKIGHNTYTPVDVQATLLALTVTSVVLALQQCQQPLETLIVCGGGVHNVALMQALCKALPQLAVHDTASYGIGPDWVEAMGFAWLAAERIANRAIATQTVTGAARPVVLGGIYHV